MERKFSKGDVVQLKSGSPHMTVEKYKMIQPVDKEAYESDNQVVVAWFDTKGGLKRGTFHHDTLELIED